MEFRPTRESPDAWHMTDDLHAEHGKGDPFAAAIRATRMSMIITDPRKPDNPIVFANDAFLRLTGYTREEILGRNCRFLQGPDTDPKAVQQVREAIEANSDISIDLLNYRKDGSAFWNALYISPVTNEQGEMQFFFASLLDVSDRKDSEQRVLADKDRFEDAVKQRTKELEEALEAQTVLIHEVDHRVKNNLQMVASLIVMQSRTIKDEETRRSMAAMLSRIEALGTVHRRLYQSKDVSRFDIADFTDDLVSDLLTASGQSEIRKELDLQPVIISARRATPVALMINELVTNALKHAYERDEDGNAKGTLNVRLHNHGEHIHLEITDDGVGMDGHEEKDSFGTRLIDSLARQLHAEVSWEDARPGTRVKISLPAEETE